MAGTFEEELKNLARRTICRALGESPSGDSWPQRVLRRLPGGNFAVDTGNDFRRTAGRLACSPSEPDLPGYRPSGTGFPGQCVCVGYRGTGRYRRTDGLIVNFVIGGVFGPVTGVFVGGEPLGRNIFVSCRGRASIDFSGNVSGTCSPTPVLVSVASASVPTFEEILDWQVAPISSSVIDNCGGEGRPPGYNGPMDYRDRDGNDVSVDVEIDLDDPYVDDDGKFFIPFVYIDPDLNINPEIELDFEPEIKLGGDDCAPNRYDPDFPPLPPGPEDPEPPNNNRRFTAIVTVATKTTSLQTTTEFSGGTTPTIYLPRLGSVVFAVAVGEQAAWTKPTDLEVLRQFTPVPGDGVAFDYNVKPALGFSIQAFPVYVDSSDDSVVP